jgi:uncharacterized protein (TIGR00369 family)
MEPTMLDVQRFVRDWLTGDAPPPPIAALIGFKLTGASDGRCQVQLTAGHNHHNPMGYIHGGIFCDIADAAMGTALASLLEEGEIFATAALSIQYIAPVQEGTLTAEARVIRRGNTIAHVECDIHDDRGDHVAKAWSTCRISRR